MTPHKERRKSRARYPHGGGVGRKRVTGLQGILGASRQALVLDWGWERAWEEVLVGLQPA